MQLVLLRHGVAALREEWTELDELRPLTPDGRRKARAATQGVCFAAPNISLLACSPLLRAMQTARIAQRTWAKSGIELPLATWPELQSAEPKLLLKRLRALPTEACPLLVGHEPGLSRFASFLLCGSSDVLHLELRKAGACALDVSLEGRKPGAVLLWHTTPRQLRRMG